MVGTWFLASAFVVPENIRAFFWYGEPAQAQNQNYGGLQVQHHAPSEHTLHRHVQTEQGAAELPQVV